MGNFDVRPGRLVKAVAALVGLILTGAAAQAEGSLPALNSYGRPPFVLSGNDRSGGLAATFVSQLNQTSGARPRLYLENLPRRRLEQVLSGADFSGLALFLAPEFLVPTAQQAGSWSVPVMVDENLIVTTRDMKISSLDDLQGLRLGGIAGHIYRALAPLIEARRIEREDAIDHVANLRKLCLGRVDFVVISKSEFAGTQPHVHCAQRFKPSAFPEPQAIVRRVHVRMPTDSAEADMLVAISAIACGDAWGTALAKYGLSTVGCRFKASAKAGELAPRGAAAKNRRG